MSQILNKVRDVDPNNSDAVKEALTSFFQSISKHTEAECGIWLRALETSINRFPKYCTSQRGTIETYLTHFLDSDNYFTVIEAAKCAHALQQVKPSQEKTATAKTCWRDFTAALCEAAHTLIGALFPHALDIYEQTGRLQKDEVLTGAPLLTALSRLSTVTAKQQNNATNKQTIFCTRLRNVFVFLQAMLVEIYPVAKPVRPQMILDVIMRALSVSSGTNSVTQSLEEVVTIKTQALRTLDALVACLGSNLLPFSPLVFKFAMQTLKWSADHPSDQSRKVRCSAYISLSRWLGVLHAHRSDRGNSWEDELTQHIIDDITPRRHVVELKMSNLPTKNLSKKAKRRLANSMLRESSMASHMPGEKNKVVFSKETDNEVAVAALEFAETFLTVCGIFLKPATHKRLQERLVRESYSVEELGAALGLRYLQALEASRRGCAPAPTHHCLLLYSQLLTSTHTQISSFCSQALLNIRMHLHCSPPSLSFAIEAQTEKENRTEKKKTISERNRVALEALLGTDRMPKQVDEEITKVTEDEPSNKRRKFAESDQISVSSESVNSVELIDDDEVEIVIASVEKDSNLDKAHEDETANDETDGNEVQNDENNFDDNSANKSRNIQDLTQVDDKQISEDKIDSTQPDSGTIFEATTQLPLHISNDDEDTTSLSMEVAYDYPNTGDEKLTILEKLEDENIPSSNDTDDIQITCGQVTKSSQDGDVQKSGSEVKTGEIEVKITDVKISGVEQSLVKPVQNGDVTESNADTSKDVTVEDMLADFVDEVNEDTQASSKALSI